MAIEKPTQSTESAPITTGHLKEMAARYMVPMSEGTIKEIAGEGNVEPSRAKAFEEYLKTTAKGLYPSFASHIDSGIPTANLLDPYRQVGKQMLGENFEPDFVNDPKSAAALRGGSDPKTGAPVPMTLDQWRQHIKQEDSFGWGYTSEAHATVNTMLSTLKSALEAPARPQEGQ